MSGIAFQENVGAYITTRNAMGAQEATAGTAPDNTEQDGVTIDRETLAGLYLSAKVAIGLQAVLAEDATLTTVMNVQDSADGINWDDYDTENNPDAVVMTGGSGGSTENDVIEMDVNLKGARRYVRCQVTANASAADTDTWAAGGVWIFGGGQYRKAE